MLKSAAFAVTALVLAATQVQAQDVHIKIGDLDLSRPEQAQILKQRIETAARDWCAHEIPTGTRIPEAGCAQRVSAVLVDALPDSTRAAYTVALANTPKPVLAQVASR